jgi:hypothetical protein
MTRPSIRIKEASQTKLDLFHRHCEEPPVGGDEAIPLNLKVKVATEGFSPGIKKRGCLKRGSLFNYTFLRSPAFYPQTPQGGLKSRLLIALFFVNNFMFKILHIYLNINILDI